MPESISLPSNPMTLTADIVAAFVAKNHLPAAELPALIYAVYATLSRIADGSMTPIAAKPAGPAVSVSKSIRPDYITCLEDGLRFQSLGRHLRALGMTPEEYRAKWKLPADYPMMAPNYSARRSELAKRPRVRHEHGRDAPRKLAERP